MFGEDGDLEKLMSDVVEFLESLFPQIQQQELIEILDLFKGNITDAVNHIISQDFNNDFNNDDEIDTLTRLFPSSSTTEIQNAWIESNGRLHIAAQYLCEDVSDIQSTSDLNVIHQQEHKHDESNHVFVLIEMFPDHSIEFLSTVFHDHGLENGISLLLNLEKTCKGDCIDTGFPCLLHSSNQNYNQSNSTSLEPVNQVVKFKSKNDLQFILPPISRSQEYTPNIALDEYEISKGSVYLRNMAQNARKARNNAYQKASSTWKTNNLTGQGSASYYGLQGRSYHDEFCKWNALAVEALLRENSKSEGVLDLHGFTVQEAIEVLPRKIQEWKNKDQRKFKIIVGRGNRSMSGSRLGPAVKKWLTDNNIRFESEPGSFNIGLS